MEKKLDLILSELQHLNQRVGNIETELGVVKTDVGAMKTELSTVKTDLKNVQSQLAENTQVTPTVYDRQIKTDAQVETLTVDVQKIHENVTALQEQLTEIQGEVEFTYQKTSKNEMELFKIRRNYA